MANEFSEYALTGTPSSPKKKHHMKSKSKGQDFQNYVQHQLSGPRVPKRGKGLTLRSQPSMALTNASSGVTSSTVGPTDPATDPYTQPQAYQFGAFSKPSKSYGR